MQTLDKNWGEDWHGADYNFYLQKGSLSCINTRMHATHVWIRAETKKRLYGKRIHCKTAHLRLFFHQKLTDTNMLQELHQSHPILLLNVVCHFVGTWKENLRTHRLCWESPVPKKFHLRASLQFLVTLQASEHGLRLQVLQWMAELLVVKLRTLQVCSISWAFIHCPAWRGFHKPHNPGSKRSTLRFYWPLPLLSWKFTLVHSWKYVLKILNTPCTYALSVAILF